MSKLNKQKVKVQALEESLETLNNASKTRQLRNMKKDIKNQTKEMAEVVRKQRKKRLNNAFRYEETLIATPIVKRLLQ